MNLDTKIVISHSIKRIIKIALVTFSIGVIVIFLLYLYLLVSAGAKLGGGLREMEGKAGNKISVTQYRNEKYGFELQFPKSWQNLSVVIPNQKPYRIRFGLNNQEALFSIFVFTKPEWGDSQKGDLHPFIYIAENAEYIFGYSRAQDYTDINRERSAEVPSIVSTFKFTK